MNDGGFYVTLPSFRTTEFPDNSANAFQNRMPFPLILGSGWEVGLSSISVPDAEVTIPALPVADDSTLFKFWWVRDNLTKRYQNERYTHGNTFLNHHDLNNVFTEVDGVEFMRSVVNFYEQRNTLGMVVRGRDLVTGGMNQMENLSTLSSNSSGRVKSW